MAFVAGYLRRIRRPGRPGRPDIGLPDPEHPVDPDYGIDEGLHPDVDPPEEGDGIWGGPILPGRPDLPKPPMPPPGIWPPLRPEDPWRPVDPGWGVRPGLPQPPAGGIGGTPPPRPQPGPGDGGAHPEHPIQLPPGMIWPPLPPGVQGKYLALVLVAIPGVGMRYRYVVVDADLVPGKPDNSLPTVPEREPK